MNNIIHLLQKDFITVGVIFPHHLTIEDLLNPKIKDEEKELITYTFKANLSLELKVGDFVLVHANKGVQVAKVVEIHETPKIDPESKFIYKWIIQRINMSEYQERIEEEKKITQLLQQLEYVEKQQELHNKIRFVMRNNEEMEQLWKELKW